MYICIYDNYSNNKINLFIIFGMYCKKQTIDKNCRQWDKLNYKLQIATGIPTINSLQIYKFDNSQIQNNSTIMQKFSNRLDCFVLIDPKQQQQKVRRIYHKKIKMQQLQFQAGHIQLTKSDKTQNRFVVLLFTILMQNSYCISQQQKYDLYQIPQGYDSIYFINTNQYYQIFQHKYLIKNPHQYVVQYQIIFQIQKQRQFFNPQLLLKCDRCQNNRVHASIYCKKEQIFLCNQCDVEHHKQKFLINHQRQGINKFNAIQLCNLHKKKQELICIDCSNLMCIQCAGLHENKHKSKKDRLKLIKKWYEQKLQQNNEFSVNRKKQLEVMLQKIGFAMKDIEQYSSNLQKRIYQLYQQTLKQLKGIIKQKINDLLLLQIECKREYDQCIWNSSFLKYSQQILKPKYYFKLQQLYDQSIQQKSPNFIQKLNLIQYTLQRFVPNDFDIEGNVRVSLKISKEQSIIDKILHQQNYIDRTISDQQNPQFLLNYLRNPQQKDVQRYNHDAINYHQELSGNFVDYKKKKKITGYILQKALTNNGFRLI